MLVCLVGLGQTADSSSSTGLLGFFGGFGFFRAKFGEGDGWVEVDPSLEDTLKVLAVRLFSFVGFVGSFSEGLYFEVPGDGVKFCFDPSALLSNDWNCFIGVGKSEGIG
jgi:hypothetical protein